MSVLPTNKLMDGVESDTLTVGYVLSSPSFPICQHILSEILTGRWMLIMPVAPDPLQFYYLSCM